MSQETTPITLSDERTAEAINHFGPTAFYVRPAKNSLPNWVDVYHVLLNEDAANAEETLDASVSFCAPLNASPCEIRRGMVVWSGATFDEDMWGGVVTEITPLWCKVRIGWTSGKGPSYKIGDTPKIQWENINPYFCRPDSKDMLTCQQENADTEPRARRQYYPSNPSKCRVWAAKQMWSRNLCGFLATMAGNPNLPLGFVPINREKYWRTEYERAHVLATDFADEPDRPADRNERVIDLRPYGRSFWGNPFPGWLYGLELFPTNDDGGASNDASGIEWGVFNPESKPFHCDPVDLARYKAMTEEIVRNGFDAADRDDPQNTIRAIEISSANPTTGGGHTLELYSLDLPDPPLDFEPPAPSAE